MSSDKNTMYFCFYWYIFETVPFFYQIKNFKIMGTLYHSTGRYIYLTREN